MVLAEALPRLAALSSQPRLSRRRNTGDNDDEDVGTGGKGGGGVEGNMKAARNGGYDNRGCLPWTVKCLYPPSRDAHQSSPPLVTCNL